MTNLNPIVGMPATFHYKSSHKTPGTVSKVLGKNKIEIVKDSYYMFPFRKGGYKGAWKAYRNPNGQTSTYVRRADGKWYAFGSRSNDGIVATLGARLFMRADEPKVVQLDDASDKDFSKFR